MRYAGLIPDILQVLFWTLRYESLDLLSLNANSNLNLMDSSSEGNPCKGRMAASFYYTCFINWAGLFNYEAFKGQDALLSAYHLAFYRCYFN